MTTWEYYVVTISQWDVEQATKDSPGMMESSHIEDRLNYWGSQGWELVTFLPAICSTNTQQTLHRTVEFHAIFKRPQEE